MTPSDEKAMTPPEYARRLGVSPEKVVGWIKSGQLIGVNVGDGLKRPRYRITAESAARFEAERSSRPTPRPKRRKAKIDDDETFGF